MNTCVILQSPDYVASDKRQIWLDLCDKCYVLWCSWEYVHVPARLDITYNHGKYSLAPLTMTKLVYTRAAWILPSLWVKYRHFIFFSVLILPKGIDELVGSEHEDVKAQDQVHKLRKCCKADVH